MLQDPDLFSQTRIWPIPPADEPACPIPQKRRQWPVQSFVCALLCAAVLACRFFSPEASAALSDLIIGTGESRLRNAVSCFETALDGGGSMGDAISVFCDEIITP